MATTDHRLRARLQAIAEVTDGAQHPDLLEELTRDYPNTIKIIESPYPLDRYTCLVHAFGFTEKAEYIAIASRPFNRVAYASPDFAHWLLERDLLQEISPNDAREGDVVFYFNNAGRLKHAGLYLGNGRVLSKWGLGYLFNHATFEVPDSYGTMSNTSPNYRMTSLLPILSLSRVLRELSSNVIFLLYTFFA